MTITTISDAGILELAEHEGLVPAPYRDSVGVWTWGMGHTAAAGGPDPATMAMAMPDDLEAALDQVIAQAKIDLASYCARVAAAITVPLAQHQFDALVSFDFNTGGILRAQLTRAINAGERGASERFFGWLRPPEIKGRRTAEKRLFDTGDYAANGDRIAIWRTNSAGKLAGVLRSISGAELLERLRAVPEPAPAAPLPDLPDLPVMARALREAEAAQSILAERLAALRAATGIARDEA